MLHLSADTSCRFLVRTLASLNMTFNRKSAKVTKESWQPEMHKGRKRECKIDYGDVLLTDANKPLGSITLSLSRALLFVLSLSLCLAHSIFHFLYNIQFDRSFSSLPRILTETDDFQNFFLFAITSSLPTTSLVIYSKAKKKKNL